MLNQEPNELRVCPLHTAKLSFVIRNFFKRNFPNFIRPYFGETDFFTENDTISGSFVSAFGKWDSGNNSIFAELMFGSATPSTSKPFSFPSILPKLSLANSHCTESFHISSSCLTWRMNDDVYYLDNNGKWTGIFFGKIVGLSIPFVHKIYELKPAIYEIYFNPNPNKSKRWKDVTSMPTI